jgi:hypothetical protein
MTWKSQLTERNLINLEVYVLGLEIAGEDWRN